MTPRVQRSEGDWKGLGWTGNRSGLHWHSGGTGGFRTMMVVDREMGRGAVVMVNTADLEPDLAVVLAVTGTDPRAARPQRLSDDWAEPALAMVESLVRRDYDAAVLTMAEQTARVLTVTRIREAWESVAEERGQYRSCSVKGMGRNSGSARVDIVANLPTAR